MGTRMSTQLDLNLIRYAAALAKYQKPQTVSQHLGISRSTLNRGLNQLREHFGDELFQLSSGRYQPTVFGQQVISNLLPTMEELESKLLHRNQFDFRCYKGQLRVYVPVNVGEVLPPLLLNNLAQRGSALKLDCRAWPSDGLPKLEAGTLAIGINKFPIELGRDLVQRRLGAVALGVYLRPDHPLARQRSLKLDDLKQLTLVRQYLGDIVEQQSTSQYARLSAAYGLSVMSIYSALACAEQFNFGVLSPKIYGDLVGDRLLWRPLSRVDAQRVEFEYGFVFHRSWYRHPVMEEIEAVLKASHQQLLKLN